MPTTSGTFASASAISESARCVVSSGVPVGQVHDDLELVLVVEGQHLDDHDAERTRAIAASEQDGDHPEEERAGTAAGLAHERRHGAPVEGGEPAPLPLAVPELLGRTLRKRRRVAQGETVNAMKSEKSIAADAPIGIGSM